MRDFCTDCYNTIDSCICNDFDAEIQRLVKKNNKLMLENENLHREMNKINETKEIILSANQTLTDHIKKQDQEIKCIKEELRKLLSLHCERCEDPAECNLCGWHLVTKELIK